MLPVARPYYDAFMELSRGRTWAGLGMAGAFPCGLAYDIVTAYGRDHGFADPALLDEFVTLVGVLDAVFIDNWNVTSKKNAEAAKKK